MDSNSFDEQNIKPENTTPVETEAPVEPVAEAPVEPAPEAPIMDDVPEESKKKQKGLMTGLSLAFLILIVVIIVVVLTMTAQKNNSGSENGGSTSNNGQEESGSSALTIDDLSSGTVTTTIGGRTVSYKAKYIVDGVVAEAKGGTYESTDDGEVVFLVINGGALSLDGVTVNKTGSEDFDGRGDSYSFYGTNSAIVVVGEGSQAGLANVTINTSVDGANAVVATNSGSVVSGDITINTTKDSSRGLHAIYGGKIVNNGGTITTQGQSCAALATDRGAGTVKVSGMKLSTSGAGSPLIYSTGEIDVASSTGTATGAQIAVVEGKNSVEITDCEFSTNGIGNRNQVDNAAVMIYQSMSGDASEGVGSFMAENSSFTVLSDSSAYQITPFFFVTNTEATIELSDVKASFYEDGYFVLAAGTNEWGKTGENGGTVTIEATNLEATNTNVGVDEISLVNGL